MNYNHLKLIQSLFAMKQLPLIALLLCFVTAVFATPPTTPFRMIQLSDSLLSSIPSFVSFLPPFLIHAYRFALNSSLSLL